MASQTYKKIINIAIKDWENAIELAKHDGFLKQLKHEITLFNIACVWKSEIVNTGKNQLMSIRYEDCRVRDCKSQGAVNVCRHDDIVVVDITITIPDHLFFMKDHQEILDEISNSQDINPQLENLMLCTTPWSIAFNPNNKIQLPIIVNNEYPIENILYLFQDILSGKKKYEFLSTPPIKPEGGDLFIYKCASTKDTDFRCDQYRWLCKGDNKAQKNLVLKTYYEIQTMSTNKTRSSSKQFRRHIYKMKIAEDQVQPIVIIHYLGSKSAAIDLPHGNAMTSRPFLGTMPSTKEIIKSQLRSKDGPQETYKNVCKLVKDSNTDRIFEDVEIVAVPRNTKQVKNFKYNELNKLTVSRDEIFSLLELARQDFKNIIHVIEIHPETNVIFGDPSCIQLANDLLKRSCTNKYIPQLVSYDTTFNLGNFYVSILVMRNTDIVGDPIFPVLFMAHEKKLLRTHELFWGSFVSKLIHFDKYGLNVPIVTDREKSIVSAILKSINIAENNLTFCHNHLTQDIKHWLKSNDATLDDIKVYTQEVKYLIETKNKNEFENKLNNYKLKWSQPFLNYFETNIEYDLKNRCTDFKTNRFAAYSNKTPTNNISESLNKMVKHWNDWNELPLDALVLSLYKMQIFYVKEFNRCYRNMGNYHLKEEYQSKVNELNIPTSSITEDITEIVMNIKANRIETKSIIEKKPTYRMTQISLANYVLENKLIDFSPHLQVHIVRNAFSNKTHAVSKINKKLQCTCSSKTTGECYHSMAVKFLSAEPQISEKVFKLSTLKKKTTRGGRKAPRPGDIDTESHKSR